MRTALSGILSIDKGMVLLTVLGFTMSECNLNIVTFKMNGWVESVFYFGIVFQQIFEAIFAKEFFTVKNNAQPWI